MSGTNVAEVISSEQDTEPPFFGRSHPKKEKTAPNVSKRPFGQLNDASEGEKKNRPRWIKAVRSWLLRDVIPDCIEHQCPGLDVAVRGAVSDRSLVRIFELAKDQPSEAFVSSAVLTNLAQQSVSLETARLPEARQETDKLVASAREYFEDGTNFMDAVAVLADMGWVKERAKNDGDDRVFEFAKSRFWEALNELLPTAALARALKGKLEIKPWPDGLLSFCNCLAYRKHIDEKRENGRQNTIGRKQVASTPSSQAGVVSPEELVVRAELEKALVSVIRALPERYKNAIIVSWKHKRYVSKHREHSLHWRAQAFAALRRKYGFHTTRAQFARIFNQAAQEFVDGLRERGFDTSEGIPPDFIEWFICDVQAELS